MRAWLLIQLASLVIWSVAPSGAAAQIRGEAIPGEPFGVAEVTLPVGGDPSLHPGSVDVQDAAGRVFYPVISSGRLRDLLGGIAGDREQATTSRRSVLFLFRGEGPLNLTLHVPERTEFVLTPRPGRPREYRRLLFQWWREYNAAARQQVRDGDYPPLVETYLTSLLGRRLGLDPPLLTRIGEEKPNELQQTFQLLLGMESLRAATMRATMAAPATANEVASQPVPTEIAWLPVAANPDPQVVAEPIALHVPETCFYVRYGSFSNYLWMDRLMSDNGGDVGSMITLRGHNAQLSSRLQTQLALQKSVLAELLGDQVISDVALIGRDLYLREGAAIGILFEQRNALLGGNFSRDRTGILARERERGATEETVQIAGRDVSFLSTPDNRIRSFYAVDGDYHLFTTSRWIVEAFYEAGEGKQTLGQSPEFLFARTTLPLEREDTIFAFFSSAFFRGLVSPQYQVELARRMRAVTDMELIQLAQLSARAEGYPADTIQQLVEAGMLPEGFDQRPDGSGAIVGPQEIIDSRRGARGYFVPIPDVPLTAVTPSEAQSYAARAAYYATNWRRLDPLMVGVKRFSLDAEGRERIVIDAHGAPLDDSKYARITSMLGPPTRQKITNPPGTIISAQAALRGGMLFPGIQPHLLFLGILDHPPLTDLRPTGILKALRILQTTPGYLGAWPRAGFLDSLPIDLDGVPDEFGFSRLPFGIWRRQSVDGFSVLSLDRELLAGVTPHLSVEDVEDPAQIRLTVGDLSTSQLAGFVNSLYYDRARQASLGNTRLLHAVSQQLHVPREQALAVAENLLDAKLVCTLGGEYELVEHPGKLARWQSTKWPVAGDVLPDDYVAPLLGWFRGLESSLVKYEDRLILHTSVDMQRKKSEPKVELPLFNLFGGKKRAGGQNEPRESEAIPPPGQDAPPPTRKNGRDF